MKAISVARLFFFLTWPFPGSNIAALLQQQHNSPLVLAATITGLSSSDCGSKRQQHSVSKAKDPKALSSRVSSNSLWTLKLAHAPLMKPLSGSTNLSKTGREVPGQDHETENETCVQEQLGLNQREFELRQL